MKADRSKQLDAIVAEARAERIPEPDWAAMDARLMAEIREAVPPAALPSRGPQRFVRAGVAVLAMAAAVAFVVRRDHADVAPLGNGPEAVAKNAPASALRRTNGAEVRIGGLLAAAGHVLRAGDVVEVEAGRAVFDRAQRVTWSMEPGQGEKSARARVTSAIDALVLSLETGTVEAQVTPVPSGEAFAIDVVTPTSVVRVAVHGTHLRVARQGTQVDVDLTEGVVSVGAPPRTGSTYGKLVTAPAHVHFDATNLEATLVVSHEAASVRPAVALGPSEAPAVAPPSHQEPHPSAPPVTPPPSFPSGPAPVASPTPSPKRASREVVASAVRRCAAVAHQPGEVRVMASSTLKLEVTPAGEVRSAVFDPPLAPAVQTCAAQAIYGLKLEDVGAVTIPIEFSN